MAPDAEAEFAVSTEEVAELLRTWYASADEAKIIVQMGFPLRARPIPDLRKPNPSLRESIAALMELILLNPSQVY
jgi:hypothetical protein